MKIFKRNRPVTTVPEPVQPEAGSEPMGREFVLATLATSAAAQQRRLTGTGLRPVLDNLS